MIEYKSDVYLRNKFIIISHHIIILFSYFCSNCDDPIFVYLDQLTNYYTQLYLYKRQYYLLGHPHLNDIARCTKIN